MVYQWYITEDWIYKLTNVCFWGQHADPSGDCVATACLPEADVAADAECFITGWGTLSSGGSTPSESWICWGSIFWLHHLVHPPWKIVESSWCLLISRFINDLYNPKSTEISLSLSVSGLYFAVPANPTRNCKRDLFASSATGSVMLAIQGRSCQICFVRKGLLLVA